MKQLLSATCMIALLASAGGAFAQKAPDSYPGGIYNATQPTLGDKQSTTVQMDDHGNLRIVGSGSGTPIPTSPPKLTAYGTLAVAAASTALSTLTVAPNSPAWSTTYPSNYVSVRNSIASTGTLFVCWLGGTCSATVGEPLAVGETAFRYVPSGTAITVFSTAGATAIAEE